MVPSRASSQEFCIPFHSLLLLLIYWVILSSNVGDSPFILLSRQCTGNSIDVGMVWGTAKKSVEIRNISPTHLRNVPRAGSLLRSWAEAWFSHSFCNWLSGAAMSVLARAIDQPVFPGCRRENWAFYSQSGLWNSNLMIQTYLSCFFFLNQHYKIKKRSLLFAYNTFLK